MKRIPFHSIFIFHFSSEYVIFAIKNQAPTINQTEKTKQNKTINHHQ